MVPSEAREARGSSIGNASPPDLLEVLIGWDRADGCFRRHGRQNLGPDRVESSQSKESLGGDLSQSALI